MTTGHGGMGFTATLFLPAPGKCLSEAIAASQ